MFIILGEDSTRVLSVIEENIRALIIKSLKTKAKKRTFRSCIEDYIDEGIVF